MGQIKIYGIEDQLRPISRKLSDVLHACVMEAFGYPADKRFHRFIYLDKDSFYYPAGRTDQYTIIEVSLFEGRTMEAKKQFYRLVFESFAERLGIMPNDVEITLFETPKHNWGIRGMPGDELTLNYTVEV